MPEKDEELYGVRLKELLLFQFIKQEKISFGKAAEIMGISKMQFVNDLGDLGIPYLENDIEEVLNYVKTIDVILEEK